MDPAKNDPPDDTDAAEPVYRRRPTAYFFEPKQVWQGLRQDGVTLCNGLIADWRLWQVEDSAEFRAPKETQVICATHSPLVLASLEAIWESDDDRLFTLELSDEVGVQPKAELHRTEWRKRGDVNSWLTSEIFDLDEPRSVQGEEVLEKARAIMQTPGEDVSALEDNLL